MTEAVVQLAREHRASWFLRYPMGDVYWICSCSAHTNRSHDAMEAHLKEVFRRKRGPIRGPQKPKP